MNVLITGGAGYIGSHTAVELITAGFEVVIVDNFCNSSPEVLRRLADITNQKIPFYRGDVSDKTVLLKIFGAHEIEAVIHFAGLKAVGESVQKPLRYYRNNLDSTLSLCEVMAERAVKKLLFSSSATVYGNPQELPLLEDAPTGLNLTNPYGQTKYMIEQILRDLAASDPSWQISCLRYFNPIGAHASGSIGEAPNQTPSNLMPFISQVAVGARKKLQIFGDDYDTPDGTGVRDYIHVLDVAKGHLAALERLKPGPMEAYNLGTGRGVSVLELVQAFEKAAGVKIDYEIAPRRAGDIASCWANANKAKRRLGWQAEKTLAQACADSWRWQSNNPSGYG